MMSFEGRAISVRKVASNKGRTTPGFDKVVWKSPSDKYKAIIELRNILFNKSGLYKSGPVRRVWVKKSFKKDFRPLGIPNMIDRALQALVLLCLDPIVEEKSDLYSFGFRKFRGTDDAVQRIRTILDKSSRPEWLWDVDISKCFDKIAHKFLREQLKVILCKKGNEFIRKWLKAPIIDNGIKIIPKEGTPQGNLISPLLCNIALNGLENVVRKGLPDPSTTAGRKLKGSWVVRYADDFVVTSKTYDKLVNEHIPGIIKFLAKRGLTISSEKSKIINLKEQGFTFLGWHIELKKRNFKENKAKSDPYVLIIKPEKEKIKNFKRRVKKEFRLSQNRSIEALIRKLNPILKGWANYYRSSYHSQEVFQSIAHYVYQRWWIWARKKHRRRSKRWIYSKYVFTTPKRSWRIGASEKMLLFDMTLAKQIKVKNLKNNVNLYLDEEYYISRSFIKNADRFRKTIYKLYNFKCVECGQALYGEEDVHLHHVIPRKDGGQYTLENIVPVHAICHESITHAKTE